MLNAKLVVASLYSGEIQVPYRDDGGGCQYTIRRHLPLKYLTKDLTNVG